MRVLFLTPTLALGGSERLTVRYALGLQGRGHEVAIAYGVKNLQGDALGGAGVPVFQISDRIPMAASMSEWVRGLRRVVRAFRPDVIHAQSVAAALVARLATPSTPMLVTMHGIPHSDEALAAIILRAANVKLTAVSDQTASGLERHFWAPSVGILNPGVDVEHLREDSLAEGRIDLIGEPRLCCVARLEHQKGIDILLPAIALVAKQLPKVGLTIVGEGTELEQDVALAAELGITEHVHFMGGVPNAAPYIAASDVMVLPSRWEGLPVVALESLALERPMVATAVNGTPTVVIEGETGWLVPPEDPTALAAAIVACVSDPEEAARRARAGHELIDARFTTARMLDRLEGLLVELRGRHARMPRTKPRPYYHAARAHQTARIAAARRRGAGGPGWRGVRIFGYHRITDDDDVYGVSPAAFHSQMAHLVRSGVKILRLSDAFDLLEQPVREAYACVTFDDGYLDNLENALPVLEELEVPATIFVIGDVLEKRVVFDWYAGREAPAAITTDELPRLLAGGVVDVQAHSRTHARLTMISDVELQREVAGSKAQIERHLPYELTSFCFPGGLYDRREVAAVLGAGFRAGVTTGPGVNLGGTGLGELRRTMIRWGDSMADFDAKLTGVLDRPSRLAAALHARRTRPLRIRAATRPPA